MQGVLATRIRDGDWVVFHTASKNRHRGPTELRAVSPRRLTRLLAKGAEVTSETQRRLLTEVGLEAGSTGDWAVRVGEDAVARVALAQGSDERWRATGKNLSSQSLRRFDPELVVNIPDLLEVGALYDYERSEQIDRTVNWSRDEDYLRGLAATLAADGQAEAAATLVRLLHGRVEAISGRLSTLGGADPAVLADIVRSGVLADKLLAEGDLLQEIWRTLRADPAVQKLIAEQVKARFETELPAMAAAARDEVKQEMMASRAAAAEQTKALIAELEAEEMAGFERRRDEEAFKVEEFLLQARKAGLDEVEAIVAASRREKAAQIAALDERVRAATDEVDALQARRAELDGALLGLSEKEQDLVRNVESLSRVKANLSDGLQLGSVGHPVFHGRADERRLDLSEIRQAAVDLNILSPAGIEAVTRMAAYFAAGEIPLLRGREAADLIEVAGLVLAGGRVTHFHADPTIVTMEDLWSRAGSNGVTPLAAAAAAAAAETAPAIMAGVLGADRSAARFWFPALADAFRSGALPRPLFICLSVDNPDSEEGQLLCQGALEIDASDLFDSAAGALAPYVFRRALSQPVMFDRHLVDPDAATAAMMLGKHGPGLSIIASMRLARVHAAATQAMDGPEAERLAADAGKALGLSQTSKTTAQPLSIVSRAANA